MRIALISIILFSHLFVFPLVKKHALFAKNEKIVIRVNRGDNLSTIARNYHVEIADIQKWNNISVSEKLYRGQKLVLYRTPHKKQFLAPGQAMDVRRPVSNWQVIKGYTPFGDNKNLGLLCRLEANASISPANSGRIAKISHMRGYGKYILIDHGNGWHSMYSNLDDVKVKSGQYVNLSETLGSAKDNKLFFLLAYNGKPVNPIGYFRTTERD